MASCNPRIQFKKIPQKIYNKTLLFSPSNSPQTAPSYSMALKLKLDFWKKIGLVLVFNPCWNRNLDLVPFTKYVKTGGQFWASSSQFQNCG